MENSLVPTDDVKHLMKAIAASSSSITKAPEKIVNIGQSENTNITNELHLHLETQQRKGRNASRSVNLNMPFYHLLVVKDEVFDFDCIQTPKSCSLRKDDFPSHVYNQLISVDQHTAYNFLLQYPAIIAAPNEGFYGKTGPNQMAYIGKLESIKKCGDNLRVEYQTPFKISQAVLNTLVQELKLDNSIANSTLRKPQWTFCEGNLELALASVKDSILNA